MKGSVLKLLLLALLGMALAGLAACGDDEEEPAGDDAAATQEPADEPADEAVGVGLVLPCPINDQSWCQQGYDAAKALEEEGLITLKYTDGAPQDTAGASQVIAQYASEGNDLVIAHSAWQDAALDAADKVPDAKIAYAGGGETAENVATYEEPIYQGAFLAGMLAGGITETDVIGGLAGQDVPLCRAELDAFEAGAKMTNPDVRQRNSYVGDWNDIAKGKETALALADQDADVLIACGGGPATGMTQAIKDRDISGFGYVADQSSLAPQHLVGSVVYNLEPYFREMVDDVNSDQFSPGKSYDLGLAEGGVELVLNDQYSVKEVPQDVMKQMEDVQEQIQSGEFEIPES